jgi:hypothetical protein
LVDQLFPNWRIDQIHYFTARVGHRPKDPGQPARQLRYLRALGTSARVSLHFGRYASHAVMMPVAAPEIGAPRYVRVVKTEEKGSDVNPATQLLCDAYEGRIPAAAVISNDSDLRSPIAAVRSRLGLPVGVVTPYDFVTADLKSAATFVKRVRPGLLRASQFPDVMRDARGEFRKPIEW